jgi:hypothetical protein
MEVKMIIITITISIVYTIILGWLAYTWYKDLKNKEDTDKRILQLEKRIEEKSKKTNTRIDLVHDNLLQLEESVNNEIAIINKKLKKVFK